MISIEENFPLSAEGIDAFCDLLDRSGLNKKADRPVFLRIRYILESILLEMLEHSDGAGDFSVSVSQRFNKTGFILKIPGPAFNPLLNSGDESMRRIRASIGLEPVYAYNDGVNIFDLSVFRKLKLSFAFWLIAAILGGVLLGVIGNALPAKYTDYANILLTPVSNVISGLISMISLPLIFLCTVSGILSCGNIRSFGKIGRRTIRGYFRTMLILLLFTVALFLIVASVKVSLDENISTTTDSVISLFFGIFPDNIFVSFANGNNIQVIFIAVVLGVALLFMGNRANRIIELGDQLRELFASVMQGVCSLMPLLVFILIAQNIWKSEEIMQAVSAWKAVVVILSVFILSLLLELFITAKRIRLPFRTVVRSIAPVCLKAFVSCSTMFVYTDMMDTLKKKLGTDEGYADFALPLGIAFFQTSQILIAAIAIYFAVLSGIQITLSWLVSLILICFLYSIAVPPVSGGLVAVIASTFSGLGISPLYLGLASTLLMILDYPNTAGRDALMMLGIARMDKSLNLPEKKKGS